MDLEKVAGNHFQTELDFWILILAVMKDAIQVEKSSAQGHFRKQKAVRALRYPHILNVSRENVWS